METYRAEPPGWSSSWDHRVLFLGNLPYTAIASEVTNWVYWRVFSNTNTDAPLFQIRCINGGHQGDHGVGKKVLNIFAFLTFQFAGDAKIMLDLFEWGEPIFQSRRLKIHPGVSPGSWLWLKGHWIQCINYIAVDDKPH